MARGQFRENIYINGKRYEVTASSEEKLKEKIEKKKREKVLDLIDENITVAEWSFIWLDSYKKEQLCLETYRSNRLMIKNHIVSNIGNIKMKDVKSVHIQRIISDLTEYKYGYAKAIISVLKQIFNSAADNGIIHVNPVQRIKNPSRNFTEKRRSITDEERKCILAVCDKHWGGLFIKVMLYCGLRPGEVCALRWTDVNLDERVLSVTKAYKADGYIGDPKSEAGKRNIFIPEAFIEDLKKAREESSPFDYVCHSSTGLPMTTGNTTSLWKSFKKLLHVELGGKLFKGAIVTPCMVSDDISLYTFRHTYCSDLQKSGVSINIAKYLLGHNNIHMTADIYTHLAEESVFSAKDAYDRYLSSIKGDVNNG